MPTQPSPTHHPAQPSRRYLRWLICCAALLSMSVCASQEAPTEPTGTLWQAWQNKDISALGDDNSGASFASSPEPVSPQGDPTLEVTPNGEADETKLALTLTGEDLNAWQGVGNLEFEVYLPEANSLTPNRFFLGLADVTDEFAWVDGVFSESTVAPGWNRVAFALSEPLRQVGEGEHYTLFLSFYAEDDNEVKTPLSEPFYLGSAYLVGEPAAREPNKPRDPVYDQEAQELLELDDDALLDAVARRTFGYFWQEANPDNGLIKDRSTDDSPSSIAAVGFGLSAIPVAIERGWLGRDEGYARTLTTLQSFADGGVEGQNGFYYHFVDMETGQRAWGSELSSIDTALFIAGALTAGAYFENTEVAGLAQELYERVDWAWMQGDGGGENDMVTMGWTPEGGFLNARWSQFDEGLLLYVLAIGSPTYPVPVELWANILRPVRDEAIILAEEPLFVYQYPQVWLDLEGKEDYFANYWNNTARACERNRRFSEERADDYATYQNGVWGLSASDGPDGYRAYGAAENNHDGTIAPYASVACVPHTPEIALESLRGMLTTYGSLVWGEYGLASAINEAVEWYSSEYIGIDQGDIMLMIENDRSGLLWNLFMQHPNVQEALEEIGFVEREADYAVTPAYLAEVREREATAQRPVTATQSSAPLVVDGNLDDWADATWYLVDETMNVPTGGIAPVDPASQTLNSRFAIRWDDTTLYLVADVSDEVVVSNIAPDDLQNFFRTDSVEFYLDPGTGLVKLAAIPFDTDGNVQAVRHEDAQPGPIATTLPGAEVASSRREGGYVLELSIPLAVLGIESQSGTTLGFSHVVHNSNNAEAAVGADTRENIIGWNPVPNIWVSPERWSTLTLE